MERIADVYLDLDRFAEWVRLAQTELEFRILYDLADSAEASRTDDMFGILRQRPDLMRAIEPNYIA